MINYKEKYKEYLKSSRWRKIRLDILIKNYHKCKDCCGYATQIHHLNYRYLNTKYEQEYCVSLCRRCHRKRHIQQQQEKDKKFNDKIKEAKELIHSSSIKVSNYM